SAEAERRAQEQASSLAKARQEAEARAQRDRDRAKADADAKLRAEMEAKLRAEAAAKGQSDLEAKMRAEADAKVKAAREAAVRAAAEAKAKAEAEMKAKLEAERAKLEEERKRIEEERKAREEAERKAKEEAERLRKEAEEKARAEAEALRKQLEAERAKLEEERRKAEQERKRKEEAERRAKEEAERKAKEEAERKAKEEAERKAKEEAERKAREAAEKAKEEAERREREEEEAKRAAEEKAAAVAAAAAETAPRVAAPPPQQPEAESFDDKLLADLESFDQRDDEERKSKEEAERQARAAADRQAREESERRQRADEAERRRRAEDDERRREEEERRDQAAREQAEREREAALVAAQRAAASKPDDDIGVSDADLDMDEVKQDQRVIAASAKREKAIEAKAEPAPVLMRRGPPIKWGRIVGAGLVLALVAGLAWLQLTPLPAADFEKAASGALGRPVRIGSARLSLLSGLQMTFRDVRVGDDVRVATVRASPEIGTLFGGARKAFSRLDLDGVTVPEHALGEVLFGKLKGDGFVVHRVVAHDLKLGAPLVLPPADADFAFAPDGGLKNVTLTGPENLLANLAPKAGEVQFELTAGRFALPMAPEISLNDFSMKGSASAHGVKIDSWDGGLFEGRFSGAADVKWGSTWAAEGPLKVRGVNVAVFAPALVSEGKGEGSGRFSMNGSHPEKLGDTLRVEGSFTVTKGTLGSIDLARAIETGGRQWSGRTQFNELNGQGVYDKGAVSLRNLTISAGAMNAGA